MLQVTLPDGSHRQFEHPVTLAEVARDIGAGLAKAAIAAKVDGKLVDLSYLVTHDVAVSIITEKDADGLSVIRHSTAHLLAQAVKQLFPAAQVTIGPVIEDGFYYDFSYERGFTPDDLTRIEQRMAEIAKQNLMVNRREMSRDQAVQFFREKGELYKAEIIEAIPANETLSLYEQGDFTDLCRGPHVPNTSFLKVFKLLKTAGAYWRGNSNNEMLQRIYGTSWIAKKDLEDYLHRIEEAEKRDHRKLGKALGLFHLQEEGPGMVFWHPDGWTVYRILEQYLREKLRKSAYLEIKTPQILDRVLWERSGHWEKFGEEMFTTETENKQYAVKPMSCPGAIQVFNQGLKSYRDLPLRLAEFGACHRCEPSGALHGLLRVRSFNQDDGHLFCTEDHIESEVYNFNQLLLEVYRDFGFDDVILFLSTRPEKRVGTDALWDKAEGDLKSAIEKTGLSYGIKPGEGAFYGPKLEYSLRDSIGRVWQLGTMQVDYCLPERLGAQYVAEDGSRKVPVMLHRAIFGTFERFMGIIIEHYAGKFPVWLAPTQAVVMSITDNQAPYCEKVVEILENLGFRVKSDLRNEKIGYKIREHTLARVPYLIVLGDREVESNTITVRTRSGKDLGNMSVDQFSEYMTSKIAQYGKTNEE